MNCFGEKKRLRRGAAADIVAYVFSAGWLAEFLMAWVILAGLRELGIWLFEGIIAILLFCDIVHGKIRHYLEWQKMLGEPWWEWWK